MARRAQNNLTVLINVQTNGSLSEAPTLVTKSKPTFDRFQHAVALSALLSSELLGSLLCSE